MVFVYKGTNKNGKCKKNITKNFANSLKYCTFAADLHKIAE